MEEQEQEKPIQKKKRIYTDEQKAKQRERVKIYREKLKETTGLSWYELNKNAIIKYQQKKKQEKI